MPQKTINIPEDYESLFEVLMGAFTQSAYGKGKERHATGEPFDAQICCYLLRHTDIGGAIFQVCKKALEAERLPYPAAIRELYGSIVYAASAIIEIKRRLADGQAKDVLQDFAEISDDPAFNDAEDDDLPACQCGCGGFVGSHALTIDGERVIKDVVVGAVAPEALASITARNVEGGLQ